ncbi:hypothetical protein SARC_03238, partial [Sphaeroforma arctica JP610]
RVSTFNKDDWGSYTKSSLHERSKIDIPGVYHSDVERPYNVFTNGLDTIQNPAFKEALEDSLHFFLEECNSLQGYQVLVDTDDAFGGLCIEVLDHIADDFGTKPVFTYATTPIVLEADHPHFGQYKDKATLNTALSLERLQERSAVYIPLSLRDTIGPSASTRSSYTTHKHPHSGYKSSYGNGPDMFPVSAPLSHMDTTDNYQGSAVLATAVRNCIYPLTAASSTAGGGGQASIPAQSMSSYAHLLTGGASSAKCLALNHSLPWAMARAETKAHSNRGQQRQVREDESTSSQFRLDTAAWIRSYTPGYEGLVDDRLLREMVVVSHPDANMTNAMKDLYESHGMGLVANQNGANYCDPINSLGITKDWVHGSGRIGTLTHLAQTSGMARYGEHVREALDEVSIRGYNEYDRGGIGSDDWEEVKDYLEGFGDVYR